MKIKICIYLVIISSLLAFAAALNAKDLKANQPDAPAASQASNETRFKGSISQSKFEMTLRRDGETLSGSYFYIKSGSANPLSLRGKIDASGHFTMQEFDSAGKQTGEFKGTWKDEPNQSGAELEGEWKKPTDKEGQSFLAYEQTVSFTNGIKIINRQISESLKAKRLDLSAEYPELTGGANVAAFNQTVKADVEKELAAFKKQMIGLTASDLKMLPQGMNNYMDIGYNIEYADNDVISVSFLESNFSGGAHPNYNYFTFTYDLRTGKEIKLAELFKPGAKYLQTISAYAIKDLQSRKSPDSNENMGLAQDMFAEGARPTAENYHSWNITKKGLMFIFDPYQVGAYAYGQQTVIVPYSELRQIARAGGVITKMMK